jgi:hypothetical protein
MGRGLCDRRHNVWRMIASDAEAAQWELGQDGWYVVVVAIMIDGGGMITMDSSSNDGQQRCNGW